ncbi:hypothetical protein CRG98_030381 [Punica granatum]|uniref:AAA+ ATPase domain-containing protein n=1 Tax=Punica granatum TaxID=22663 RepID=A0A2I0IZ11_PUNGR|nr:hypothetical protein CRG98_030381 [Punica granatum]
MDLLDMGIEDVRIVGICGMGGVGKTAVAKFVCNQLMDQFEHCSFLSDIREKSLQPNGTESLQRQLVFDILRQKHKEIPNVDRGKSMLKGRLHNKKVLILLDDVDRSEQLSNLLSDLYYYAPGSRIIVTTRNLNVLDESRGDRIYRVTELNQDDAFLLFCKHAFRQNFPISEFADLSWQIAKATGGLPLAIEVIGSYLSAKLQEDVWREALDRLRKEPSVQDRLRISFDALNHDEREIFLDIACLYAGTDYRVLVLMWKACGFSPASTLQDLCQKSMVKIGDDKEVWMHDQIKDLGREIVHQENYGEPGERSRLWRHEDAIEVLEYEEGTSKVKAIRIDHGLEEAETRFRGQTFEKLTKLLCLELGTPQFSSFPPIKRLILDDCYALAVVHHSVGYLTTLESLSLKNCCSLERLPEELGSLTSLTELVVDGTLIQEIPASTGMACLKTLSAKWCKSLTRIPESIECLKKLQRLLLNHCRSLRDIPSSIGELQSLEELNLSHTSVWHLPYSVGNLINLRMLDISHSPVRTLPCFLGKLHKLEVLNASHCQSLAGSIPFELDSLPSLRILRLDHTGVTEIPSSIHGLFHLQTLDLRSCVLLRTLPELPFSLVNLKVTCRSPGSAFLTLSSFINLKQLEILGCIRLTEIPENIGGLSRLKELSIGDCPGIQSHPLLPSSLRCLRLSGLSSLESLPNLSNLGKLSSLSLTNCPRIVEIPGLKDIVSLRTLRVSGPLANLNALKNLTSLSYLSVDGCKFKRLPDLSELKGILHITVRQCRNLIEIQGFSSLRMLRSLSISDCTSLPMLTDLSGLKLLEMLNISGYKGMETLPDLSSLRKLKSLKLGGMEPTAFIHAIRELASLEIIDISSSRIQMLPDLSPLLELKQLKLHECQQLKQIPELTGLSSMEILDIYKCEAVVMLPNLSSLRLASLGMIDIYRCGAIEVLPDLSSLRLTSLEILEVSMCQALVMPEWTNRGREENIPGLSELASLKEFRDSGSWYVWRHSTFLCVKHWRSCQICQSYRD